MVDVRVDRANGVEYESKVVTTAGTEISLSPTVETTANTELLRSVLVKAKATNAGAIYIGPIGLTSSTVHMVSLEAGKSKEFTINHDAIGLDAAVDGEGADVFYLYS